MAASDRITVELVPPPAPADDVCPLCWSWRADGREICDSCEVSGKPVGFPIGPPSIVTLYAKPSPLRDWLTRYKGRPGDAEDPFEAESFEQIRALLGRYLLNHGPGLAELIGPLDAVVVVPSARQRPGPHPLASLFQQLQIPLPVIPLLERGPGELGFRRAAADGYRVSRLTAPMRVVLVDDVFVTGARLFSAARTLLDNGHTIPAALVLARRVNLDWGKCRSLWERQRALGFDWATGPRTSLSDPALLGRLRGLLG